MRSFLKSAAIAAALVLALAGQPALAGSGPGPIDERALFRAVGAMYGIDPDLLAAIASVESGGRADARSPKGAAGLMQLMPTTARSVNVDDPYDPIQSALGAARFIAFLRHHQAAELDAVHLPELLAAYNAGEAAVERYRGVPPYSETREYVRRVLWLYLAGTVPPEDQRAPATRRAAPNVKGDAGVLERLSEIRKERAMSERDDGGNRQ